MQFVRKLFTADGRFDGVIVASLDPAFLSRFYGSLDIGRGALLLIGQDGTVRAAAPVGVAGLASDLSPTHLMQGAAANPHGYPPTAARAGAPPTGTCPNPATHAQCTVNVTLQVELIVPDLPVTVIV